MQSNEPWVRGFVKAVAERLYGKSVAVVRQFNANIEAILLIWVAVAAFACGLRISFAATPVNDTLEMLATAMPYVFVVGAPVVSVLLAMRWFPANALLAQPEIRLARMGKWRTLDFMAARSQPLYGATGLMASLLVGMLLNIPVRTLEFLTAIPALGGHAPGWFLSLYVLMLADVVLLTSLYAIAFVMALRHVPWFPRFLVLVWGIDLMAQTAIADVMATVPSVPPAVDQALATLLEGNSKKVLISMALWLPYLLFSRRVNLTYRSRVPA